MCVCVCVFECVCARALARACVCVSDFWDQNRWQALWLDSDPREETLAVCHVCVFVTLPNLWNWHFCFKKSSKSPNCTQDLKSVATLLVFVQKKNLILIIRNFLSTFRFCCRQFNESAAKYFKKVVKNLKWQQIVMADSCKRTVPKNLSYTT